MPKWEGTFTGGISEDKRSVGGRRALEEGRKRESLVGLGATGERACRTQGMLGDLRA